jgi:ubiquitin carboxyl-terminal hydrolase 9/24
MLQAKLLNNNVTNSPDSSEESSGGSPNHFATGVDGPNLEAEECLPSVMMSSDERRMEFLSQLSGLGASIGEERLRDGARLLLLALPRCRHTERSLKDAFLAGSTPSDKKPYNVLFNTEPAIVLYRLEVLYTMLFPAVNAATPQTLEILSKFFISGGATMVVEMLTKNNFMPLADVATKRSAYLAVLKLTKAVLTVTSHLVYKWFECAESESAEKHVAKLRMAEAIKFVPNPNSESTLRAISEQAAKVLFNNLKHSTDPLSPLKLLVESAIQGTLPDTDTIRLLIKLSSATASGSFSYFSSEQHQANRDPMDDDVAGWKFMRIFIHCLVLVVFF